MIQATSNKQQATSNKQQATRDKATRRQGDKATRRQGDKATRRQGDKATRRQGDKATRRQGDKATSDKRQATATSTKHHSPSTTHQAPLKHEAPSTKHQVRGVSIAHHCSFFAVVLIFCVPCVTFTRRCDPFSVQSHISKNVSLKAGVIRRLAPDIVKASKSSLLG